MHSLAQQQYRMIHDIYVLLDDGDRHVLRPFSLSLSQYAILQLLDAEEGWRLTDISERLLFDKSTVTRIIDRLEESRLVQRIADPTDRRVQRVILTGQGLIQRDRSYAAHAESIVRRMGVLDEDEQQQLRELLDKLRSGLQHELDRQHGD
jgi:DNA-binding MarR family transcriptional regulator